MLSRQRRALQATLERCGWEVEIADAQKVKGLVPLACKTDRIDAWVLAELCLRDEYWQAPSPQPVTRLGARAERRLALARAHAAAGAAPGPPALPRCASSNAS
jgi:transposase